MSNFLNINPENIFAMTDSDIPEVANIHRLSQRESEKGIIIDSDLDRFDNAYFQTKWAEWSQDPDITTLVYKGLDGGVQGFISYGRVKTRPPQDRSVAPKYGAEIYAVYVHPDHWRKGIAKTLMQTAMRDLSERKINSVLLWVLKKNKRASALYESFQGERIAKQRVDIGEKSWAEESCFAWRDVRKVM